MLLRPCSSMQELYHIFESCKLWVVSSSSVYIALLYPPLQGSHDTPVVAVVCIVGCDTTSTDQAACRKYRQALAPTAACHVRAALAEPAPSVPNTAPPGRTMSHAKAQQYDTNKVTKWLDSSLLCDVSRTKTRHEKQSCCATR